jgi:hypothetical protein
MVRDGAQGTFVGSTFYRNHSAGVMVYSGGPKAELTNVLIEQTQPSSNSGKDGAGIVVFLIPDGLLTVKSSAIIDNVVTGIGVALAQAVITDSLIAGTSEGSFIDDNGAPHSNYGDGIVSAYNSTTTVERTIVERVARAGIVFDQSAGSISSCEARENKYGVVIQREPRPVFSEDENSLRENKEKNYISDGDLSIPSGI